VDAGVHGSTYSRDHRFAEREDLEAYGYANRGYKREASAFGKVAHALGAVTLYGDVQLRAAAFRYRPTAGSPVPTARASWTFLNPKAGLTWRAARGLSLFASYGATGREPTRADLLGGADDVAQQDAPALLPLTRVRPERLRDAELGADWRAGALAVRANAVAMEFRDEIGLTGETTPLGYDVRRNFGRSTRRGVEVEASLAATPDLTVAATAAASRNRVVEDREPATGATLRGVPLALSPAFVGTQRVTWRAPRVGSVNVEGRYQSRSYLAPTRDAALSAPAFFVLDGGVTFRAGRHDVLVQGRNLLDRLAYPSGDVMGGAARYFVLAPRNVEVTARVRF
jgi:iron complex outermembrane receptor protein